MNRIRERRLELGMTQQELSAKLRRADPRMDVGMVSRFECGACLPTLPVLAALETALQAPRSELYDADELAAILQTDGAEEAPARSEWTQRLEAEIPFGRENAISRRLLAQRLGLPDRTVRSLIEQARAEGVFILNAQDGRGYFRSADVGELRAQYKQDTGRALAILARRAPLRRYLKSMGEKV